MKVSSIKGLSVDHVDEDQGRASVSDLILDVDERRVLALQLSWSSTPTQYAVSVDDVQSVGSDGVSLNPLATILPLPDLPQYLSKPSVNRMLGERAVSEVGTALGDLSDIVVDTGTWTIRSYSVVRDLARAFENGPEEIPADRVATGAESLMVKSG